MSKYIENFLNKRSPAEFVLTLGLILAVICIGICLCLLPVEPDLYEAHSHYLQIQTLIATAIAVVLQGIVGAGFLSLILRGHHS